MSKQQYAESAVWVSVTINIDVCRAAKGMKAFVTELTTGFTPDLQRVVAAYKSFIADTAAAGAASDVESAMATARLCARSGW